MHNSSTVPNISFPSMITRTHTETDLEPLLGYVVSFLQLHR